MTELANVASCKMASVSGSAPWSLVSQVALPEELQEQAAKFKLQEQRMQKLEQKRTSPSFLFGCGRMFFKIEMFQGVVITYRLELLSAS